MSSRYSQLRVWAASSASRARSSWLLASAKVLNRFCFFCALSCDWSLPPFDEAFARACRGSKKKKSVTVKNVEAKGRERGLVGSASFLTSAASAAFLRASLASPELASPALPSVRGGPPTFWGTRDVFGPGGGAEPRRRPG